MSRRRLPESAPDLKRLEPAGRTAPEPLLNGRNLDGRDPSGNPASSHLAVKDDILMNQERGANVRTMRTFNDFTVHFDGNCPDHANSGFYPRGRYEVQLEYEPLSANPAERRIESIYGRIADFDTLKWPSSLSDLNTQLREWVWTVANRRVHGTTHEVVDARWDADQFSLQLLDGLQLSALHR
jgi:hypothetical protein